MGTILAFLGAIPTIFSAIKSLLGVADQIRRMFQTDPVAQQKKANDAQKVAQGNAGSNDDTSGLFGGESK